MRTAMKVITLICSLLLFNNVQTKNHFTIDFVKSFVINEQKPTFLICVDLCWRQSVQILLQKELINASVRFSTQFRGINVYNEHHLLFLIDLDCPNGKEYLQNSKYLRFPFRWLALKTSSKRRIEYLEDLPLLANSDFVLAEMANDVIKMTELHKSTPNGSLLNTPRGNYDGSFVDTRPNREMFRRRRDIKGHPLTMANVIQDSNSTMYHLPREDRLEPQFDSYTKISWSTVRLAFQMLNATPQYIFSHRWGFKQNGKWTGMIDDINSGRADLGTNCMINTERMAIVAYTDTVAPFRVKFIFRQPPLPYVANIFSMPFSTKVWIALSTCAVFSSFTIYLASRWERRYGMSPTQLDGSIGDALLFTMSAVSQQGCAMEPRKLSGRIMLLVVFTALMALYAAYSANIVVLLQAPSNAIQTLEQLAHSKITIAANDVDYNHFVFSSFSLTVGLSAAVCGGLNGSFKIYVTPYKDPIRILIHKRLEPERGNAQFYDINEGVERIRKGLFAFHSIVEPVYRRIEQTFLQQEKCDLMEVDFMNGFYPLVPVKKDSPYLELLRVVFKQLHESGIRSALCERLQVPKPRCPYKVASFSSVGLDDLQPVIIFMLYGFLVSVAILLLEILYSCLNCQGYSIVYFFEKSIY